jgi:hypothetical protein
MGTVDVLPSHIALGNDWQQPQINIGIVLGAQHNLDHNTCCVASIIPRDSRDASIFV